MAASSREARLVLEGVTSDAGKRMGGGQECGGEVVKSRGGTKKEEKEEKEKEKDDREARKGRGTGAACA